MIPEHIPVFVTADIIPPPAEQYEDEDGRKSTVGWLKSLFLWREEGDYCIPAPDKDQKDYEQAYRDFKRVNKIGKDVDLHDWEEKTNASQQRIALNKFRKEMGYVVESPRLCE